MKRPLSMTGFGCGECAGAGKKWTVEYRSVNHRQLDIKIKMPWRYAAFEERMKKEIALFCSRGHVDVNVSMAEESAGAARLRVDMDLARQYHACLQQIGRELSLAGEPDLAMVTAFRDIISSAEEEISTENLEKNWPFLQEALVAALKDSQFMRENEGQALKDELLGRLDGFAVTVKDIEGAVPALVARREQALKERLDNLLKGVDIDPSRLAQEAAILVDKSDITEEVVRLQSHIEQFHGFLESDEPVGRRLDFLLQEFLREVNTIASKAGNVGTSHQIVDLKNELEKMREQVQNLE